MIHESVRMPAKYGVIGTAELNALEHNAVRAPFDVVRGTRDPTRCAGNSMAPRTKFTLWTERARQRHRLIQWVWRN